MTHKKKIKILDSLFEKAMNLTEDPNAITQFRQDFVFYTKIVMRDDADDYLSEADRIVFYPHIKQHETTSTINLQMAGFPTAKEEYCHLIEKMRASIELNNERFLPKSFILSCAETCKEFIIGIVSSLVSR